jgi:RNA polymerase sigma-70 factor (ECF subfamily)
VASFSQDQFVALVQANQGIIHKVCSLYCNDKEERRDLFQEITLQLWRSLPNFRADAKITTWMYRVALNTAITFLRKQKKAPEVGSLPQAVYNLAGAEPDPEKEERLRKLYLSIEKLTGVEKAIMMLYLEEHDYAEISEIVGITQNYVRVKMNRIIHKLRKQIT